MGVCVRVCFLGLSSDRSGPTPSMTTSGVSTDAPPGLCGTFLYLAAGAVEECNVEPY